jgi:hypothetical protein
MCFGDAFIQEQKRIVVGSLGEPVLAADCGGVYMLTLGERRVNAERGLETRGFASSASDERILEGIAGKKLLLDKEAVRPLGNSMQVRGATRDQAKTP